MKLEQLIRERRTIRKFNSISVSPQLVKDLLSKAESLSPYDGEVRWRYIFAGSHDERVRLADYLLEKVVDNKIAKIALSPIIKNYHRHHREVPANIIVLMKKSGDRIKDEQAFGNVCCILQSFQLLAWEEGLGMVWMTEPMLQNESFFKNIGLKENEKFVGMLNIGYFDKIPKGRKRKAAEQCWSVIREVH
ncbi:hypothetical protein B4133_1296 [Bacillus altitudinis]|uniref:nitroreductase family protein n=1 Tax=Bacillus altitudinis TaxID=293387 RepID=UPI00059735FD|nr:nitroreductase family protein [Bacillus altitudinis]KIL26806.1 hypothetical protein B4133_1296 [Bacillus altitudinis]